MVTDPCCWFWPGLAAGMLVLLSRSLSNLWPAGMCAISFDVLRQWCERHNWCRRPDSLCCCSNLQSAVFQPRHISKRRNSHTGYSFFCPRRPLSCLSSCFGSALISGVWNCEDSASCPHLKANAVWKDWSDHSFCLNLGMQQTKIYLLSPTLGCFFKLGHVEHGVKIKAQWKQQQQQPEKLCDKLKAQLKKNILQWATNREELRAGIKQTELVWVKSAHSVKYKQAILIPFSSSLDSSFETELNRVYKSVIVACICLLNISCLIFNLWKAQRHWF